MTRLWRVSAVRSAGVRGLAPESGLDRNHGSDPGRAGFRKLGVRGAVPPREFGSAPFVSRTCLSRISRIHAPRSFSDAGGRGPIGCKRRAPEGGAADSSRIDPQGTCKVCQSNSKSGTVAGRTRPTCAECQGFADARQLAAYACRRYRGTPEGPPHPPSGARRYPPPIHRTRPNAVTARRAPRTAPVPPRSRAARTRPAGARWASAGSRSAARTR